MSKQSKPSREQLQKLLEEAGQRHEDRVQRVLEKARRSGEQRDDSTRSENNDADKPDAPPK